LDGVIMILPQVHLSEWERKTSLLPLPIFSIE